MEPSAGAGCHGAGGSTVSAVELVEEVRARGVGLVGTAESLGGVGRVPVWGRDRDAALYGTGLVQVAWSLDQGAHEDPGRSGTDWKHVVAAGRRRRRIVRDPDPGSHGAVGAAADIGDVAVHVENHDRPVAVDRRHSRITSPAARSYQPDEYKVSLLGATTLRSAGVAR